MKASKEEVDYSKGMKGRRCGLCRYYHGGTCSLVEGEIKTDMWCELYKRKQ